MILNKPYTSKEYADFVVECNKNNLKIVDKGEYMEGIKEEPSVSDYNEEMRLLRQQEFALYADPLKYNYEEACARYGISSSEAIIAKNIWLEKKDEIRNKYPYKDGNEQ